MSWIIFGGLLIICGLISLACVVWENNHAREASGNRWDDTYVPSKDGSNAVTNALFPVSVVLGIIAAVCLVVMGLREWVYSYNEAECKAWADELDLDVRWELTGYWDGNCLVDHDGQWLNRTQWETTWRGAQLKEE